MSNLASKFRAQVTDIFHFQFTWAIYAGAPALILALGCTELGVEPQTALRL
jgi:hypothetical protein